MVLNIFSKEHIVPYFFKLIYVMLFVILSETIILTINYYDINTKNQNRIQDVLDTEGIDLNLLCNVANCNMIKYMDRIYIKDEDSKILRLTNTDNVSIEFGTGIEYSNQDNSLIIYSDRSEYLYLVLAQYLVVFFLTLILFTWYYLKNIITEESNNTLKLYIDQFKLAGKMQNIVAESAYHEMMTPVSAIKTGMSEILKINNNSYDNGKICISNIKLALYKRYTGIILDNIERLETVLQQMSDAKVNKTSKEKKSIYELIKSANESLQIFHINSKFDFIIKNIKLMEKLYPIKISNGAFLNILNNFIKNALEAGATKILYDIQINKKSNKVNILITDNGTGIPNIKDETEYDKVFNLGFSSKDYIEDKLETNNSNWLVKFIYKIYKQFLNKNIKFIKVLLESNKSHRGFGLYVSREIARHGDGDIKVIKTSTKGTVFMLTILVE